MPQGATNVEALGDLFYTDYFYLFQAAGLILLVAMIGAITLTLRAQPRVAPAARRAGAPPPGGDRGSAQGPAGERHLMAVPIAHYLTVAAILFTLGIFGIFVNRKNVIIILMSIELMLLAINLNSSRSRLSR